jgi:hypothetical protein
MLPRTRRFAALAALALVALAATAVPASAAFDETPDPTWMTNGTVYSVIRSGNVIYIGGNFTSVRPCAPGTACPGVYAVNNLAAIDATTGQGIRTFRPAVTGGDAPTVYGLAMLGGKLFVGGKFTTIGGEPHLNFGAVNPTTGAVVSSVTAQVGADTTKYVRTLATNGTRVYAGGYFSNVGATTRKFLAAFDADGTLDPAWSPRTSSNVRSLEFSCDGATIFAGGIFRKAAGPVGVLVSRESIARFDVATAALHPWQIPPGSIPNELVAWDLATTCATDRIFVGYGGQNWAYAIDTSADDVGEVIWTIRTAGNVQAVEVHGDRVLLGGHFSQVNAVDIQKAKRTRFAVVDFDGNLDPWAPSFDGRFFGPWDILSTGNQVYVGGNYSTVSGVARWGIARFTDTP